MNYVTSNNKTKEIKIQKEYLIKSGYKVDDVADFVSKYMDVNTYKDSLKGKDNLFLVMPSTSGRNIIPLYMSALLQNEYGGTIAVDYALPMHKTKSAYLGAVSKIKEPREYLIRKEMLNDIDLSSKNIVIIDDVVTSGTSVGCLQKALEKEGIVVNSVVSIAQSEKRLVSERDIERLSEKLVPVNGDLETVKNDVALLFDGKLKHAINTIEREVTGPTKTKYRDFIYEYITEEARRIRSDASLDRRLQSGQEGNATIYERRDGRTQNLAVEERQEYLVRNTEDNQKESIAQLQFEARQNGYLLSPEIIVNVSDAMCGGYVSFDELRSAMIATIQEKKCMSRTNTMELSL